MDEHEHQWKPVPGLIYALRRCAVCQVIARNSNGILKIQICKTCKGPANDIRLGTPYCFPHVPRPGKLRTLEDMSEEEIQALERLYGKPIKRPNRP